MNKVKGADTTVWNAWFVYGFKTMNKMIIYHERNKAKRP